MTSLLSFGVVLSAIDHLSPTLGSATGNLNKLDEAAAKTNANLVKFGTASLALGEGITAPLKAAYNDYQELARAQGEVASLGIDDTGIKSITKSAREFSSEFAGTTAPEFVKASYDIKSGISSLGDIAVGQFTKISALTGAATKSSTNQMTSLFASGYGIYRKQFEKFGEATILGWNNLSEEEKDIKFGEYFSAGIATSVQQFKTDGGNMSAALSNLGATATSAGIEFAEQLTILGQLQATMSGSEAATKYRAFLGSVFAAGDKLDLQFTDANNQLLSMPEIISRVKDKYGETIDALESDELKKAFGTEEAVALLKLLYNETGTLTTNIDLMNNSLQNGTEKAESMAKAMNKGKEWEIVGNKMQNASTMIGGVFAPTAAKVATVIGDVVGSVTSWMSEHETLTTIIVSGIGIFGGLLTVLGSIALITGAVGMAMPFLVGGISLVTGSFGFLGAAIVAVGKAFLMNPIFFVIGAIAGAAYLIYRNWEQVSGFFIDLWSGITNVFQKGYNFLSDVGKSTVGFLKSPFESFFNWIGSKFEWIGNLVGKAKSFSFGSVKSFFGFGGDDKKNSSSNPSKAGSIEQIRKEVYSRPTVGSNQMINRRDSKTVNTTDTYHITINEAKNKDDVLRALEEHSRKRRNRSYEDEE